MDERGDAGGEGEFNIYDDVSSFKTDFKTEIGNFTAKEADAEFKDSSSFMREERPLDIYPGSTTIMYINNIPWWTTEQKVQDLVSQFGPVRECHLFMNKKNGKSRGNARIDYIESVSVPRSINVLNESELDGQMISASIENEYLQQTQYARYQAPFGQGNQQPQFSGSENPPRSSNISRNDSSRAARTNTSKHHSSTKSTDHRGSGSLRSSRDIDIRDHRSAQDHSRSSHDRDREEKERKKSHSSESVSTRKRRRRESLERSERSPSKKSTERDRDRDGSKRHESTRKSETRSSEKRGSRSWEDSGSSSRSKDRRYSRNSPRESR